MILPILIFVVLTIFASFYFLYVLLKPYLKDRKGRRSIVKWYLLFCLVCFALAMFMKYVVMREPDYFEQGIEQLHTNNYVLKKINGFDSYSFRAADLPKNPANYATFNVELNGDSLKLFLTCTMKKMKKDWKLVKIKQDSVSVNK